MSKRDFARSVGTIMILTIISQILGFCRESLIAYKYGISFSTDIYVFAVGITEILFALIGSSISTTFMPILSEYIENKSFEERNYFVNNILNITLVLASILCILGVVFTKYLVLLFGPGFATKYNAEQFLIAVKITRLMLISLVFIAAKSVFMGILQAHESYAISASVGIILNTILISYLSIFGTKFGVFGLTFAIIIAYMVQAIIHIPKLKKLGYRYTFILNLRHESIKKIGTLVIPTLIGTGIAQINFLVDRMLATNIGEGAIATMNFANRLNLFVYSIFGTAISTVLYTKLSVLSAKDDCDNYNQVLIKAINVVNLLMIPATIGVIVLRIPFVSIAFKRGAFDNNATLETASVLLFFAPAMIAYAIRDILNRAFYSIQDTKTPMINSAIGVIMNIILNIIFVKFIGINGIALGTSVSSIITIGLLLYNLNKKLNFKISKLKNVIVKICISSVVMGVFVFVSNMCIACLAGTELVGNVLSLIISSAIGMVVYFIMCNALKIEECVYITDKIKNKLSGRCC